MLADKALLVTLSLSHFSPKKTDKRITAEVARKHGTSDGALRVAKRLLPDEAVEAIKKIHGEIRDYHYKHTVPWGENNERLLCTRHYFEYTDWMMQRRMELDSAVREFLLNYPSYVETAKIQLNGAFNPNDYPTAHAIEGRFAMNLNYSPMPTTDDFRISIPEEEMTDLRKQLAARTEECERFARADVVQRIAKPLAAMVNRLNDPDAVFRDTLVQNLREICDTIPVLNITDDPAIQDIHKQIKGSLYNADADLLRDNKTVRSQTAKRAQDILDKMSEYFPEPAAN